MDMKQEALRWGKIVLIAPIVILWDVTYYIIDKVYLGATWIDENGGKLIEDFVDGND
jgi:hypothetical protein